MYFLAANFSSKLENKREFFLLSQNILSLQGQISYTDLSKINWLCGVIRILRVLRYKVIYGSKSFSNNFGF